MKKQSIALACTLALTALTTLAPNAWAVTAPVAKTQLAADNKAALTRYEADKKLCNDETTSNGRLQCRRDAKSEYNQALAEAKARMAAASKSSAPAAACADCGKVVAVSVTEKAGEGGAAGMIAGGIGGALLGNQVGGGIGKDLATIAGAAGGAYAGKMIEGRIKTHKVWNVSVHYPNGEKNSFEFDKDPGFTVGDSVKNAGNSITRQ
jgi:outer membrane lipoprotein SlyB